MKKIVCISGASLAVLLSMAHANVEDVESGLEQKIYEADENQDLDAKKAAIKEAEECLDATQSSVKVAHWDAYSESTTEMTHQFDVDDQRASNGQMFVDIGALEGHLDDMLGVTLEVGSNPLLGTDQAFTQGVPCAHVHFDGSNMAMSLFKIGDKILIRPESDVTVTEFIGTDGISRKETLFWVE